MRFLLFRFPFADVSSDVAVVLYRVIPTPFFVEGLEVVLTVVVAWLARCLSSKLHLCAIDPHVKVINLFVGCAKPELKAVCELLDKSLSGFVRDDG